MTEAQTALSRRAVACKGWRWRCGMFAALDGIDGDYRARVCRVEGDKFWSDATTLPYDLASYVPDLRDHATLGCLLALVREAWGCAVITSPDYDEDEVGCQGPTVVGWRAVETVRWMPVGEGKTEAEALVAALEAAP
jgi:hypothetical protein